MAYYTASLLLNACLIAFYAVQVFTAHPSCLTQGGTNITHRFNFAFATGLILAVLEAINTNVFGIVARLRVQKDEEGLGEVRPTTRHCSLLTNYADWGFRASAVAVSMLQYLILRSKTGVYCADRQEVLAPEKEWLLYLISCQLAKAVLLSAWDLKLKALQLVEQRETLSFDEKDGIKIVSGSVAYEGREALDGEEGSNFLDKYVDGDLESFKHGLE